MILHELFRVVSRFPRYISCYIAESRLSLGQLEPGTGFITVADHFVSEICESSKWKNVSKVHFSF